VLCKIRGVVKKLLQLQSTCFSAAQIRVPLLQPAKVDQMQALELGTNSCEWSVGCCSLSKAPRHTAAPDLYFTERLYHHLLYCDKQVAKQEPKLRPTCCNGLLPLMGGDSQWPIRGPAAALLGMLQLRVVDPVRAKAALRIVFPPAAVLPTSDLPGA